MKLVVILNLSNVLVKVSVDGLYRSVFGNDGSGIVVKRLNSDSDDDDTDDSDEPDTKIQRTEVTKPTNILTQVCSWLQSGSLRRIIVS